MTLPKPNYLPKIPSSSTISLQVKASTYKFEAGVGKEGGRGG